MISLLLAIIYLTFISLGLPDSLLGSGWPVMHQELGTGLSAAGIITMIISLGTIVSSLLSDRVILRFGTGLVTAVSTGLTALALLGFSFSGSFLLLCLLAVPYGLGAGAIDAALNNYVALHYSSRCMSWLHAFWGIGVSISPYIMSLSLRMQRGWQAGYRNVSLIQIAFTLLLFFSLPVWKKVDAMHVAEQKKPQRVLSFFEAVKIPGVRQVLLAFFAYCALESTAGIWASSYLVEDRGVHPEIAALFGALFFLGITGGRLLSGFVADTFGDRNMIRGGALGILFGILLIALPLSSNLPALIGLSVLGLGAAPIYPSIIHSTPRNFGAENSQSLVGIQMAAAYTGSTLMPYLFGLAGEHISIGLYPACLGILIFLMLFMTESLNRIIRQKNGA